MGHQDNPNKGFYLFNEAPRRTVCDMEDGFLPAMVIEGEVTGPALVDRKSMGKITLKNPLRPRQPEVDVNREAVRYLFPIDR